MTKTVDAVYENGVFRPKTPVELDDKAEVRLLIETRPKIYDDEEDPTGWKTVRNFVGFITEAPEGVPIARDHDKYLDDE